MQDPLLNPGSPTDRIEKQIQIAAPIARVWRALTDHNEFGSWFRVKLESPFVAGQSLRGRVTYPGYEHVVFDIRVIAIEPRRYFSYAWHPYAVDPQYNYDADRRTLVEFFLSPASGGTLLKVTESGFDAIPPGRRSEAFRMNSAGWHEQVGNIARHVSQNPAMPSEP